MNQQTATPQGARTVEILRVAKRARARSLRLNRAIYVWVGNSQCGCSTVARKVNGAYALMVVGAEVWRLGR